MKPFFTAITVAKCIYHKSVHGIETINYEETAKALNAKLEREGKVVYGFRSDEKTELKQIEWDADEFMHTHKALLVCVEPLEDKPENPEPLRSSEGAPGATDKERR